MSDINSILPLPNTNLQRKENLSDWVNGSIKPVKDGAYLREFDDGEAVSWFYDGQWCYDGFFPSDIQDARWCGLKA